MAPEVDAELPPLDAATDLDDALTFAVRDVFASYLSAVESAILDGDTTALEAARRDPRELIPPLLDTWPPVSFWQRLIIERLLPRVAPIFRRGWSGVFTVFDTEQYLAQHLRDTRDRLTESTWPDEVYRLVREAMQDAAERREPVAELRRLIRSLLRAEGWADRADQVARNETQAALNAGAFQAARARERMFGQRLHKRWVAVSDGRVRPDHWLADGQVVAVDEPFTVGGESLMFPHDPTASPEQTANCRCVVNWLTDDEADQARDEYRRYLPGRTDIDGNPLVADAYVRDGFGQFSKAPSDLPTDLPLVNIGLTDLQHRATYEADPAASEQIRADFAAESTRDTVDMTTSQERALGFYTIGQRFHALNNALRKPRRYHLMSNMADEEGRNVAHYVHELRSLIGQRALPEDTTVFRGTDSKLLAKLQPGDEVEDLGFMSVSKDPATSREFLTGQGDQMLIIRVPKGTHYARGVDGQAELILAPGTKLRVIKRERQDSDGWTGEYVHAEVITNPLAQNEIAAAARGGQGSVGVGSRFVTYLEDVTVRKRDTTTADAGTNTEIKELMEAAMTDDTHSHGTVVAAPSQAKRDRAKSAGDALPDGSFPIENGSDLDKAISLAGNGKNPAAARRHIIKRAKALGLESKIPDSWKTTGTNDKKPAKTTKASGSGWAEQVAGRVPSEPPADWFRDPGLSGPTKIRVTDDGRVYGHVAAWDTEHAALPGVTAPRAPGGSYGRFHRHPVRTASGERVKAGPLATGGHASTDLDVDLTAAQAHYDDPSFVAADVVAGEDEHGIWVSGALRPGISPFQVMLLDRYSISGDWRDGELVAACSVSVPGFHLDDDDAVVALAASAGTAAPRLAESRPRARLEDDGHVSALVAAGIVRTDQPAAPAVVDGADLYRQFKAAERADQQRQQRIAAAKRRVLGPRITAALQRAGLH